MVAPLVFSTLTDPAQYTIDNGIGNPLAVSTPGAVPFYTEAEIFRAGLSVPFVVCGPGSIRKAHRVDESVGFDQLSAGQALYEDAIDAFCR